MTVQPEARLARLAHDAFWGALGLGLDPQVEWDRSSNVARSAWAASVQAVLDDARQLASTSQDPQWALIEAAGHRYVGKVTETTRLGQRMLCIDQIGGGETFINPGIVKTFAPMTEQQARRYAGLTASDGSGL